MSNCAHITLRRHQSVLQVGLNRPEKKNALTVSMYEAIGEALLAADNDPEIKAIVLHGTAEAFSSGNDLREFDQREPGKPSPAGRLLLILHGLQKPLIAAVSGLAVGIGTTLLLHCDLVVAAPDTRFRLPFVDLGLCPEAGSSLLLPASVGHRLAAEVLMLGDFFTTEKARELGIVNQVVATDQVLNHAVQVGQQLAAKPGQALMATKRLLKQATRDSVEERMRQEFQLFSELLVSEESVAIRQRFNERRSGALAN